jgi:hypothetical protein
MSGDAPAADYWREVLKRACNNTLHRVGWDPTKVILAIAFLMGAWVLGIIVVPATNAGALLIGIAILLPFIFVWGVVQAQAHMYRDLMIKQSAPTAVAPVQATARPAAPPKPDFDMWRHKDNLTLLEAAQLWAEVTPSLTWGTRGSVKNTYAMLEGAIQKGELAFDPEGSINPSAWDTAVQMERKKPDRSEGFRD